MQRLREVRIDQPYLHIPTNPSKQAILLFLAEFLTYATRDEQQNVPLFLFIRSSLLWLDETEARFANFHLVFMARMSRFLGFGPTSKTTTRDATSTSVVQRSRRCVRSIPTFCHPKTLPMSGC